MMVDDNGLESEETVEDPMLREAMDALRLGDRGRARDLLTRLLKTDQKNPQYWLWLSAAVDTQKERIYCLQMVLQADPQNSAAKRGLILLGALPPDNSIPPFPLNRPRLWEEKLIHSQESMEKTRRSDRPLVRILSVVGISIFIIAVLIISRTLLFPNHAAPYVSPTRRPTFTPTLTQTVTPEFRTATPTFIGATPLWMFLASTYTPTPLYVITTHPVLSRASYEAGLRSMGAGDYDTARVQFQDVLKTEPNAVDVYYYIGESYRLQGNFYSAKDSYQEAINHDPTFAPAFLGRARANLGLNREVDVLADMNEAIDLDGNFAEAYIARGEYTLQNHPSAAKVDLETALELTPNSALAYLYLSEAELNLGDNIAALDAAMHANELDMTLVPVYLALAKAYIKTGQTAQAVDVLQTYVVYNPGDASALLQLGIAYNTTGNYEAAVEVLSKSIDADQHNPETYFQRGTAYLNLDSPNLAETDFNSALNYDLADFDSYLGLARSYFMQGYPNNAYIEADQKALPLAHSDGTKAQVYYWEAQFLEAIGDPLSNQGAQNSWESLIALPADAMPEAWRVEAFQHLKVTPTFTPTLTPTISSVMTPAGTMTVTP
jgi:tetratricopeptide (TPR) repeat protein